MPDLKDRLGLLRRMPRVWRQAALVAALRVVDGVDGVEIARELVQLVVAEAGGEATWWRRGAARRRDAALTLLRCWPRLTPDAKNDALSRAGDALGSVLEDLVLHGDACDRQAAAAFAADAKSPAAIELCGRLVLDADDATAGISEGGLLRAAQGMEALSPEASEALDVTLTTLARGYGEHRRRGVMFAIARAADRPGRHLRAFLDEGGHPGHMALRAVIRQSTDGASRARCVRWLANESLAPAALERLRKVSGPGDHEAAMALGYLLAHPRRVRRLRLAEKPSALLPSREIGVGMSRDARQGMVRWVDTLALAGGEGAHRLSDLITDESAEVRHAAVRAMAKIAGARRDATVHDALLDFAFDADERVARGAAIAIADRGRASDREALMRLARSPHESVRGVARLSLERVDAWGALVGAADDRWKDAGAARLELKRGRAGAIAELRTAISSGAVERRVRAMLLALRLGVAREVELELLAAIAETKCEGATRLAATAVRALAEAGTAASRSAVHACMEHSDLRVRANAVEAAARGDARHPKLVKAVSSDHARTRANAIRARLLVARDERAEADLAEMLGDERPEHRISALWVTERAGRTALAERVAAIARSETPGPERDRARRCARRLLAQMRAEWSDASRGGFAGDRAGMRVSMEGAES